MTGLTLMCLFVILYGYMMCLLKTFFLAGVRNGAQQWQLYPDHAK